jgi:hypothetical protein
MKYQLIQAEAEEEAVGGLQMKFLNIMIQEDMKPLTGLILKYLQNGNHGSGFDEMSHQPNSKCFNHSLWQI